MTKAGTVVYQIGINAANHMIIGPTTGVALITTKFELDSSGNLILSGALTTTAITASSSATAGSCTLNGASPSVCTATVTSGCKPVLTNIGTGVALAWSPNASVSGTTLTIHGANAATNVVEYHCI